MKLFNEEKLTAKIFFLLNLWEDEMSDNETEYHINKKRTLARFIAKGLEPEKKGKK